MNLCKHGACYTGIQKWITQSNVLKTPVLACLYGGGGPQVGEVTHLTVVEATVSRVT